MPCSVAVRLAVGIGTAVASAAATAGVATGAVATGAAATAGVATGAVATGAVATAGVATGAVATGAVATGAVATGAAATGAAATGAAATGAAAGAAAPRQAQPAGTPLYRCLADAAAVEAPAVGLVLCDAEPTDALRAQAEPDNLQIRDGALVVEAAADGRAAIEGLQAGDLVYRVAGVDVAAADAAAARLARVEPDSDTLVNFLRGGRPYRVKLRR